jgi:hypothetical protein
MPVLGHIHLDGSYGIATQGAADSVIESRGGSKTGDMGLAGSCSIEASTPIAANQLNEEHVALGPPTPA